MKSFKPQVVEESKSMKARKSPEYAAEMESKGLMVVGEHADTPADVEFKAAVMAKPVRDTPPEPTRVTLKMYNELSEKVAYLVRRVKNLEERLENTLAENGIVTRAPKMVEVVDDTHPPLKTTNGHPISPSGMVAPFIEVPSLEAIMTAAKKYKAAHGDGPFAAAVKSFNVNKLSELSDEQRALFLERITDNV